MTIERLTEPQFDALVSLTSIRSGSATHAALHQHLVLGYSRRDACESSGVSSMAISTALRRLRDTDAAAHAYLDTLNP